MHYRLLRRKKASWMGGRKFIQRSNGSKSPKPKEENGYPDP
jgi:hypothetical protein